jgi:phosphoenolpyruvate synthase/pyruvate phosphate dikinase
VVRPDASPHIIWLDDCDDNCVEAVGHKATGLGYLLRAGMRVPPGFAVTTDAYREHVAHNRLADRIVSLLSGATTFEAQQAAAAAIVELFDASEPSPRLRDEILAAYDRLGADTPVAVRSSANAEDLGNASFAGQQETYLWILDGEHVLRHVVRCWASLFTSQAIAYRAHLASVVSDLAMGVVVQCMVPAAAAGVMLTIDPVTGDRSTITIEAAYGLGAAVVNGEVDPDRFCVDKSALGLRSRTVGSKQVAYRFDPGAQGTRKVAVGPREQRLACVSDDEVLQLATMGLRMEQAMGCSQDIEWAISAERELFLLQSRPETVWSQQAAGSTPAQ